MGKILDPAADKLTQSVMLLCLLADFPILRILFFGLIVKEVLMCAIGGWAIHKTGTVYGALWHGKLTTCLIYSTIVLHLCRHGIPHWRSAALTGISFAVMVLSFILYTSQNVGYKKGVIRQDKA